MAKSKRGPSLFEMLEGADAVRRAHGAGRPKPAHTERRGAGNVGGSPPVTSDLARATEDADESLVQFDGERLRFSFSSISAAFVIFIALGCMAGIYFVGSAYGKKIGRREGYEAGRVSYATDAADEIAAARLREPASRLVDGLTRGSIEAGEPKKDLMSPVGSTPVVKQANPWVRGLTYIVVQEFASGNASHVEPARRFLSDRGVEAVAVPVESGGTQLITKQGYNRRDATQRRLADKLKEKIHAVGRDYYASGGGYRFEGYFRTLKHDRW